MSERIIDMPDEYLYSWQDIYYPDERDDPMSVRERVVRCRDCTGFVETWDGYECERFSGEYHRAEPNGFCAWGERRNQ